MARITERGSDNTRPAVPSLVHLLIDMPMNLSTLKPLRMPVALMATVIVLSNILVQHPINDWLTWGAFSYPLVFLVGDLTNRALGPQSARRVAWAGFAVAVGVSLLLAPWRIALASGCAFFVSQVMDIAVFNRWRRFTWWKAPLIGSLVASVIDTAVFFFLAFAGDTNGMDWQLLAAGDLGVKALMALLLLAPYRALLPKLTVWAAP
jgi:queuosine precursor transporter